jgi:N-methylhydantoinase B
MPSGGPAQTVSDGLEVYAATCMSGCDMPDVELEETSQPGMILWRRVAPDTGGAGVFRGGNGVATCLAILHCDRMTGGAYTNTAQVPPRGAAGGYPGAAGTWEILHATNIVDLLERGEYPTEESVTGAIEAGPSQSASLVFLRSDVYTVVHGGGGGVGDPLLRDPALVTKDVRDGYVSAEAGRDLYGVVLTAGGELDAAATAAQRAAIRERRIGRTPERTVRPNAPLFAPLGIVDGRWRCALCEQDLGDEHDNWRAAAITSEHEISERYEQLHSKVRPRVQAEPVVIRENFCPGCAGSLAVDVTLEGHDPVPASRPGVNDPYAAAT